MAFGKNDEDKTRLRGSFSQRAAYSTRRPERTGRGGGGGLYWADNYKPSFSVDTLRLVYAEYPVLELDAATGEVINTTLPWYPIVEHFHGGLDRGGLCSAGPQRMLKNKRDLCYGCDIHWEDYAIRKEIKERTGQRVTNPNRISMSDKFVFTVVDQGQYFKTEQLDREGRVRLNNQNQPFYEWRKLGYANDPAAAGREIKNGMVLPWLMNRPQFEMLQAYVDSNIGKSCAGCGTYGNSMQPIISVEQYMCVNCQTVAINVRTSTMTPLQISETVKQPYNCQTCGVRNFLDELVVCMNCLQRGTTPRRASIWDIDIQVQMQRDPANPSKSQLMLLAYSQPRPIDPAFQHLAVPLDLPSKFKPTSPEEQRKIWKLDSGYQQQAPQGNVQGQQPFVPYGQQPHGQNPMQYPQQPAPHPQQPQAGQPPFPPGYQPNWNPPAGGNGSQ